jgi:hypothetical protein
MPRSRKGRVLTTVAGAALLTAGVAGTAAIATAPAKPGITVRSSPLSQSIMQGGQARYINRPPASSLSMSVTPRTVTVGAGSVAGYAVRLRRVNLPAPIGLAVVGALPPGSRATFTSNPVPGTASTLRVSTSATTKDGDYSVNIVASGPDPRGRMRYAHARVVLVVHTVHLPFQIWGQPEGLLGPGASRPIDLVISNPNSRRLAVTHLTVTVRSVTRTGWAVARNLPCGTEDYAVRQYSGAYPLGITARGRASLSGLHVATSAWPAVSMLDRRVNQDGCKGATLGLAYAGSGQGS